MLCISAKNGKARLSEAAKTADKALDGLIGEVCRCGDFSAKAGQVVCLHTQNFPHKRVMLAGLGDGDEDARDGIDAAFAATGDDKSMTVAMEDATMAMVDYAVISAGRQHYKFKLGGHFPANGKTSKVTLLPPRGYRGKRLTRAAAVAEGVQLTRHLAEQPGNICTPPYLAQTARELAKKTELRTTVLDEKKIKSLGMGALLAVARGSALPPRLIVLEHRGGGKAAPLVLVGKGVTFDTGGISIKPAAAMDEMKFDMCGAATVFGVMLACARAKTAANVVGIIPACENMPDGNAVKPGDVITAMNGKTIEVLNTDAEGRLILADALTYAEKYKPAAVIDIATLTGACVIALGNHTTGLMGRGDKLLAALQQAGNDAGDACWRLPLGAKYQQQLKSDYADIANIGGRGGGTITAACFLSRFTECPNWAHLDIAGTAWTSKKRATARPVPLLMQYIEDNQ